MEVGSKEWEEYVRKKWQKEFEEERANTHYRIEYNPIYIFDDNVDEDIQPTKLKDERLAKIYNKYIVVLKDLYEEFYDYFKPLFNKHYIKGYENMIQCDKETIDKFKFRFYHILYDIYKDVYGHDSLDEWFLKFVDNVDNDMQGAARCVNNIEKLHLNLLNDLGYTILSFDHKGRWFESFRDKCYYLDKENS